MEAQARQACSSETASSSNAQQPEKQGELVTMETQPSPALPMRKSVSIAVSTGNALFLKNRLALLCLDISVILSVERTECIAEMLNAGKHMPRYQNQPSLVCLCL